jgi:Zn-dependent protease with chaperone function
MSASTRVSASADAAYELSGTIEPTRLSLGYRVGLVIVAAAMLVLPLLYLGLIVLAATTVWWHLTANAWILSGRSGGVWRVVAYFGPAVAGLILIFFMVKPVLARPATHVDPLPIHPENEPALFRFISQICRLVGAPIPSRIQVDCQVNASASFSSIALALTRPRFVLTIGLPLAAGLTVRQFAGVMAHEFGHFAQMGGMRLTFVVRSINAWFGRVVHERDEWDEKLERWSSDEQQSWMIGVVMVLARFSVWCSRRALAALMMVGHGISCFMLRQMEYDADSYEIKLVGSNAFIETSTRMRELNVAAQIGHHELRDGWLRKRLPSNLPAFMLQQGERMPAELLAEIRKLPEAPTDRFDTHPSAADRVRAAERANSAGIMRGGDVPATVLFRDFAGLSAEATRHHYEHDLGLNLASTTLIETEDAMKGALDRERNMRSVEAFFGERFSPFRLDRLRSVDVDALTEPQLIQASRAARDAMANADPALAGKYRRLENLEHSLDLFFAAERQAEAGFQAALKEKNELVRDVSSFEDHAARRLAYARALLTRSPLGLEPAVREALLLDASRAERALDALAAAWVDVNELRRLAVLFGLLSQNGTDNADPDMARRRNHIADQLYVRLKQIRKAVGETPSPDLDAPSGVTLASLLGLDQTVDSEVKSPLVVHAAIALGIQLAGRLAAVALQVEAALDGQAADARV